MIPGQSRSTQHAHLKVNSLHCLQQELLLSNLSVDLFLHLPGTVLAEGKWQNI